MTNGNDRLSGMDLTRPEVQERLLEGYLNARSANPWTRLPPPEDAYPTSITVVSASCHKGKDDTYYYDVWFTTGPQRDFSCPDAIQSENRMGQVLSKMCEFAVATHHSRNRSRMQTQMLSEWSESDEAVGWQKAVKKYCAQPDSKVPGVTLEYGPTAPKIIEDTARSATHGLQNIMRTSVQDSLPWPTDQKSIADTFDEVERLRQRPTRAHMRRASPAWSFGPPDIVRIPPISSLPVGIKFEIGTSGSELAPAPKAGKTIRYKIDVAYIEDESRYNH